jgi:hypothetical protein
LKSTISVQENGSRLALLNSDKDPGATIACFMFEFSEKPISEVIYRQKRILENVSSSFFCLSERKDHENT